jgi:Co/Zn/Cd efflux system component
MADTMRSITVLLAAGIGKALPTIPSAKVDAVAAVVVSSIILVSVLRLVQGLIMTATKAFRSRRDDTPSHPPSCERCSRNHLATAETGNRPILDVEPVEGHD